jgi:hypothetical protein
MYELTLGQALLVRVLYCVLLIAICLPFSFLRVSFVTTRWALVVFVHVFIVLLSFNRIRLKLLSHHVISFVFIIILHTELLRVLHLKLSRW